MRLRLWGAATAVLMAVVGSSHAAEPASQLDRLLAQENAGKKVQEAPTVDRHISSYPPRWWGGYMFPTVRIRTRGRG